MTGWLGHLSCKDCHRISRQVQLWEPEDGQVDHDRIRKASSTKNLRPTEAARQIKRGASSNGSVKRMLAVRL